jgi:predicted acylesterase/phospholipase RssA
MPTARHDEASTGPAPALEFNLAPAAECDLVMKGGLTSGVVYPPAVLSLQQRFRFRSIGGTSAGAIAAAVTAAAELGRESGGYQRLDQLRRELARPDFLFDLFQPSAEARPAFEVLSDLFLRRPTAGPPRSRFQLLARARRSLADHFSAAADRGVLVGAAIGAVPALLMLAGASLASSLADASRALFVLLVAVAAAGVLLAGWAGAFVAAALAFTRVFTEHLPARGFFGLCLGYAGEGEKRILTTWLADQIDGMAGRDTGGPPLTFGELASKKTPAGAPAAIELRMVTSNLSHGQPYVLPFARKEFLFRTEDMARLFPARVVKYLEEASPDTELPLPPGFHFLPERDRLPVIVATRLSLSFPLLVSAVPLYSIDAQAFAQYRRAREAGRPFHFEADQHLQRNWFSDGGISSNFPIHFFDEWLPSRPTFGINLAEVPATGKTARGEVRGDNFSATDCDEPTGADTVDDVYLPHPREGGRGVAPWRSVNGLLGFAKAIVDTALGYRDGMQAMLPSYRERVVQVRLAPHEGGLNLAMDPATIELIGQKGRRAGELLADMDFRQHQWVRLLVLMAYLERGVYRMRTAFPDGAAYDALFREQLAAFGSPARWYRPKDQDWCDNAGERLRALLALLSTWDGVSSHAEFFGDDPPRPAAALRVTPPL